MLNNTCVTHSNPSKGALVVLLEVVDRGGVLPTVVFVAEQAIIGKHAYGLHSEVSIFTYFMLFIICIYLILLLALAYCVHGSVFC